VEPKQRVHSSPCYARKQEVPSDVHVWLTGNVSLIKDTIQTMKELPRMLLLLLHKIRHLVNMSLICRSTTGRRVKHQKLIKHCKKNISLYIISKTLFYSWGDVWIMNIDIALLVIDVQNGMFQEAYPVYDGDGLLERISGLIKKARACDTPVIYVQHNEAEGLVTNSPAWNIHPMIAPVGGDTIIQKYKPDSFHETNLHTELMALGIRKVVLVGIQTDMCIDATSHRANELGYQVTVVKDCHSTYSQGNQSAAQIIEHYNEHFQSFAENIESSNIKFC
jgi:nicotinamidase-related amidase